MKLLWRLVGFTVFLAPMAALAILGGSYFLNCLMWVSAPGESLVLPLQTENGILTLKTGPYAIDPLQGFVNAHDLELIDSQGKTLAKAGLARVSAPGFLDLKNSAVRIDIDRAEITLERNALGEFEILKFFKQEDTGEEPIPIRLSARNTKIRFVDQYTSRLHVVEATLPIIEFASLGDSWRGRATIAGFGGALDVDGSMEKGKRLSIRGKARTFDAARIWEYVQDLPELEGNTEAQSTFAQSAKIDGTFRASWQEATGFQFDSVPTIQVRGLRTPHWPKAIDGQYQGTLDSFGSSGVLDASDGAVSARFLGQMSWKSGFLLYGNGEVSAPSINAIPQQYRIGQPRELSATGLKWSGPIRLLPDSAPVIGGLASADRLIWSGETAQSVSARILSENWNWSAKIQSARWRGSSVTGAIQWNQQSNAIGGFFEAIDVALAPLAQTYLNRRVDGRASIRAQLSGSANAPVAELRTNGSVSIDFGEEIGRRRGLFEVAARLTGSKFLVERAVLTSGIGAVIGDGSIDLGSRSMDLRFRGAGIDVGDWVRETGGLASVSVRVLGKWDDPRAIGRVEVLNASFQGQNSPIVAANLRIDSEALWLEDIGAVRGASRLDGSIRMAWRDQSLKGQVEGQGLQLFDFLGEGFGGSFDIQKATVGGTLQDPVAAGSLQARDLVLQGVRIDAVAATAKLSGSMAMADSVQIRAGEGEWNGEGWYEFSARTGRFSGKGTQIDLEKVMPVVAQDFVFDGLIDFESEGSWEDGKLVRGRIEGEVEKLKVNPTLLGSGTFSAKLADDVWKGSVEIGQPERYVQVPAFEYAANGERIDAQLVAFGIPIHEIYLAIRPKFASLSLEPRPGKIQVPERVLDMLRDLQGSIGASVIVRGDPSDPSLDVESLEFADLSLSGEESGTVAISAKRAPKGIWSLDRFEWSGGPGRMTATGRVVEGGDASISGDLSNFRPAWLSIFDGRFAGMDGVANLHFDTEGPIEAQRVTASLDAFLFAKKGIDRDAEPEFALTANVAPITIDEKGIVFEGDFDASGVRGGIDGRIPFAYPFEIPSNQPVDVAVSVPRRRRLPTGEFTQDRLDLKPFAQQMKSLRLGGEQHHVQANIRLGGTLEALQIQGEAIGGFDAFGIEGIETELKNLDAKLSFDDDKLTLTTRADSNFAHSKSTYGSVVANATVVVPDALAAMEGDWESLWKSAVKGKVVFRDFRVKEVDATSGGAADVVLSAELRLGGTAAEPLISTVLPAKLESLSATMPTVFPEATTQGAMRFNPRFALNYVVANRASPANVKAITANFDLYGAGSITGSLAQLNAAANLTVERGAIRLPNARVAIEENGKVRFLFKGRETGQGDLRLDVDLVGQTNLSSVRAGGTVQRYDINLNIRGNLLDESSQFITARSDPPDLDQAQILNLLGQRELFEGLANQFVGDRRGQGITQVLAGAALPVLLDPFTQRLAQELGLEFIQLDYNAFEGASITAAKAFGKGWMFQGRRQLQEQFDGRIHFDYRLTWRPPSGLKNFRNLIFSVGADQDRPWKISVEYGIRF